MLSSKCFADQSVYIPKGAIHRLTNEGVSDLTLIEVQTGAYLGEETLNVLMTFTVAGNHYVKHPHYPQENLLRLGG